jgi:exodeoxyribonuclease-5
MAEKDSDYKFRYVPKANKKPEELLADIERKMGGRITENSLSQEQREVFDTISHWYEKKDSELMTLGGYAGTGKSTLVSVLANKYIDEKVAFCAYTGKATSVLRKKFYEANIPMGSHDISTLHSLLYHPIPDEHTGGIRGWKKRPIEADLIVVDEASMLNKDLYDDLRSAGVPILAVGDHGQLPPVFGNFSLMERPQLRLETIHRQAQDSPILALSEFVRRTGQIPRMPYTDEVQVLEMAQTDHVVDTLFKHPGIRYDDVALLCYRNETRVELNARARQARGFSEALTAGDQVMCLRNTEATIFNGMRGTAMFVRPVTKFLHEGRILFEDDEIEVEGLVSAPQFNRPTTFKDFDDFERATGYRPRSWSQVGLLMDYGYALTIHKSQGSQFEHAIVLAGDFPQHLDFETKKRALYTAVTRCSKYLVVLQ